MTKSVAEKARLYNENVRPVRFLDRYRLISGYLEKMFPLSFLVTRLCCAVRQYGFCNPGDIMEGKRATTVPSRGYNPLDGAKVLGLFVLSFSVSHRAFSRREGGVGYLISTKYPD